MSLTLGNLLWWRVGEVQVKHSQVAEALGGLDVGLPARPIPVDVYRRLTKTRKKYLLNPQTRAEIEMYLAPVSAPDKMLVHHVVGAISDGREVIEHKKFGEFVFYVPPRGQHSRARIRLVEHDTGYVEAQRFMRQLRQGYDEGVDGALDGQAVRRIVRAVLAAHDALYVGGPYFYGHQSEPAKALEPMFELLGDDSFVQTVPVPDAAEYRQFLARAIKRAEAAGTEVPDTIRGVLQ